MGTSPGTSIETTQGTTARDSRRRPAGPSAAARLDGWVRHNSTVRRATARPGYADGGQPRHGRHGTELPWLIPDQQSAKIRTILDAESSGRGTAAGASVPVTLEDETSSIRSTEGRGARSRHRVNPTAPTPRTYWRQANQSGLILRRVFRRGDEPGTDERARRCPRCSGSRHGGRGRRRHGRRSLRLRSTCRVSLLPVTPMHGCALFRTEHGRQR
jgi:hypothetical protein